MGRIPLWIELPAANLNVTCGYPSLDCFKSGSPKVVEINGPVKATYQNSKPIKTSNKQLAHPNKKITILSSFQNIQPSKQAPNISQNINQPPSTPTNHLQPMDVQLFSDSESLNSFTSHPKSSTDSFARCPKRNATPLTGQAEQWFVAPVGTEWYGEMLGNQLVFKSTISLSNDMS